MRYLTWLYCAAALAQQQPAKPAEKASIEGMVVSAATSEPLKKTQVHLRSNNGQRSGSYTVTTDPGGNFVIGNVEPGNYRLSAERAGFVHTDYGARTTTRAGAIITLDAGQKLTGLVVRLIPQAVVTGRVLDEDGDPMVGAFVTVMRYRFSRGRKQLTPVDSNRTDDQGEYRIHSLAPGKYFVSATRRGGWGPPERGAERTESDEIYAPTYYPNTVDPSGAAPLNAAPGAVLRNVDITLTKVRTVKISGRVIDPGGAANATGRGRGTFVSAVREGDGNFSFGMRNGGMVNPDGSFVLRGLRPGAYNVVAERWAENLRLSARVPVAVGANGAENLTLNLTPAMSVKGQIKVEGSTGAKLTGVNVSLQSPNETAGGGGRGASGGRLQADGSFTLANVVADQYIVLVSSLPEGTYVKAVQFGEQDVLVSGLQVAGGSNNRLEILLSPGAGQLEAIVLDAKQQPAAGAVVLAAPRGERASNPQFYRSGTTDQYGRTTIKGLAPGDYDLYAWEEVEPGMWLDPDFLKIFEKQAQSLTIKENAKESKQLPVIAAGDVV